MKSRTIRVGALSRLTHSRPLHHATLDHFSQQISIGSCLRNREKREQQPFTATLRPETRLHSPLTHTFRKCRSSNPNQHHVQRPQEKAPQSDTIFPIGSLAYPAIRPGNSPQIPLAAPMTIQPLPPSMTGALYHR